MIGGLRDIRKHSRADALESQMHSWLPISVGECPSLPRGVVRLMRQHNPRHAIQGDERSKEKFMRKVSPSTLRKKVAALLALVFVLGATASTATPKHSPRKPATQPTRLIAHLVLPGGPPSQIFLREQNGKKYLLIRQISEAGVTVVDVTKPTQPNIVKRTTWSNDTSSGNLEIVGGDLTLEETPESTGRTLMSSNSKETVQILDLTDPTSPTVLESFSGVTSILNDAMHNLLYITNGDGLWILRQQTDGSTIAQPHRCLSEDALNEVASCQ
jgi:hypothetical protein